MSRLSKWNGQKIADMDFKHLNNTLRLLKSYARDRSKGAWNGYGYDTEAYGRKLHEWVTDLDREIKKRMNTARGIFTRVR